MSFLALDAMLGWKVKKYDGSWTEWGNLTSDDPTPGDNTLPAGSPWSLSNATYTDNLNQGGIGLKPECQKPPGIDCGRTACLTGFGAVPDQTNENDKQICDTGTPLTDCVGNPN